MVPVGNIWAAPIPSATRRHFTVQLGSIRAAPTRSAIPRPITAQADSIRAAAIVSAAVSTPHSATPAVDPLAASNAHPPYLAFGATALALLPGTGPAFGQSGRQKRVRSDAVWQATRTWLQRTNLWRERTDLRTGSEPSTPKVIAVHAAQDGARYERQSSRKRRKRDVTC